MAAFIQHIWAEWREQRSNLLGLWSGLILLIIALAFFGGADFINHHLAPMWFAGLGCLAFTLTVTPRVFAREEKALCKGFLRRSAAGVHLNFLAKAVYLNLALGLTALIPLVSALAVIYWLDPRTVETIGKVENGWGNVAMLLLTWHSVPLVLLAWGLPWRWSLLFSALVAVVIGASMYAAFLDAGAFTRSMSEYGLSDGALLTRVAMVLAPWAAAWVGYVLRRDTGHVRRGLACVGVLALVHAPAWAYYVPRAWHYTRLDTTAASLSMRLPILSPDKRHVFVGVTNGDLETGGWRPPHGIRIDLQDGTFEDLGYGGFQAGDSSDQEGRFPTACNLTGYLTGSVLWPFASPLEPNLRLDPNTGKAMGQTSEVAQSLPWYPKASTLGLPSPWWINSTPVGIGYTLRNHLEIPCRTAVYDLHRQQIFLESTLPMGIPWDLKILPGKWLIPPGAPSFEWLEYDPDTGVLSASQNLTPEDVAGPVLRNGSVLLHRNGHCYLYDPVLGEKTPLAGGPIPGAQNSPLALPRIASELRAPVADWYDLCLVTATEPQGERDYKVSLGWLQAAEGSLKWFPWKLGNHVFAATNAHTVLFLEGSTRIRSLDLNTGEIRTLFPRID